MAEVRIKVKLGFLKHVYGPTEEYISRPGEFADFAGIVNRLIQYRNGCLTRSVLWAGVRIGVVGSRNQSTFYPPGIHSPFNPLTPVGVPTSGVFLDSANPNMRPDQSRSCLQIRVRYDATRSVIRYFAFVPDTVVEDEPNPPNFGAAAEWKANFDSFVNIVIADGWSIRARNVPPAAPITDIGNWVRSTTAPNNIGITVPSPLPAGIVERGRVSIRGVRRRGTDKLSYNGQYVVQTIVNQGSGQPLIIYLRGTENGDPESVKLMGTVQGVGYSYFAINRVDPIRCGVHKRGKPLGSPRGSRRKRESLDP